MKQGKSFLTRLLALVLALVMVVSNANLGLTLTAFATEGENKVTAGELVAENYELTDAEKALLNSGYLVGDTYSYNVPADSALVAVDTEAKTISAAKFENWVPTTAMIVVGGETKEGPITLTDGKGNYEYDGNAFAVKVEYVLTQNVDEDTQELLLDAGFFMKDALADIDAVFNSSCDGYLTIIGMALPTLKQLTGGGISQGYFKLAVEAAAEEAILALDGQMTQNGGKMDFEVASAYHQESASDIAALLAKGQDSKTTIENTYKYLLAISQDPTVKSTFVDQYLENTDPTSAENWSKFKGILTLAVDALKTVAEAEWDVLGVTAVKSGLTTEEYVKLDALVAALGAKSTVTVKETLNVANTSIQANLSMFDIVVTVKLQVVEDKADSAVLVKGGEEKTVTLTLAKDATAAEIEAAILASGIDAEAKAAWGDAYKAEHYEATATALPEKLTEDIEYTVTYAPKSYTITYGDGFADKEADTVPYGYQLTLPRHSDAAQAYDYTVNGAAMSQGAVYTVVGNTTVSRAAGKAYTSYSLYTVIAENYANDNLEAILTSGALNNDKTLNLRKPDPADADSLLKLSKGTLTAVAKYDADYAELNWVPDTYGATGTEAKFNGNTVVSAEGDQVTAIYRLDLTNIPDSEVENILKSAIALKTDAADQIATLDRLAAYRDQMVQLDKVKLGALNGVIDVTDLHEDPAKNAELRAELKAIVGNIIANNLDADGKLKIYNMLVAYSAENGGGLTYYYNNAAAVINEINSLAGYLGGMLDSEDKIGALEILTEAAGYPEYAEKIVDLEDVISGVQEDLKKPADLINLDSPNLYKLIEALSTEGEAAAEGAGSPYLHSAPLTVTGEGMYQVIVKVYAGDKDTSFNTSAYYVGNAVNAADIEKLIADAETFAVSVLGNTKHYKVNGLSELRALGSQMLETTVTKELVYEPINYTVKIDGGSEVTVNVDARQVILPKHDKAGYIYEYTTAWDGKVITPELADASIILTDADLDAIADGKNTVARKEIHKAADDLEDEVEKASTLEMIKDGDTLVGIKATLDCNKESLTAFATELTALGYDTIRLNGDTLLGMNEDNTLEISLQVLMDAILEDNSFGSEKLIALNNANGGEVMTAKMDLGDAFTGLDFTLSLTSVPAQMAIVADGLATVRNFMSFNSNNGELKVNLNLPEKVYEVYLTALIATGNADLTDVDAVNNEIAFNFLNDYIQYILGTEADAVTFQNTLEMLKVEAPINVSDYNNYYKLVKKALTADGVKIGYREDDDSVKAEMTATGKKSINYLMGLVGVNPDDFSMELGMIKEYKDGGSLNVTVTASLSDADATFEAVVIDLSALKSGAADINNNGVSKSTAVELAKGNGIANGLDFTTNIIDRLAGVAGESIVVLLNDVNGDLYFTDGAVLDLNGFTVNGDITANGGNLIIVDSTLATFEAGTVTGAVNGSVHILAGCYPNDTVEEFLKDGYRQNDNGYVQNVLYWVEGTGNDLTIVLNSDYMYDECVDGYLPSVAAIAAEIAADLSTKYIVPAAVSVDGYSVYNCDFDKLISLLKSSTTIQDAANMLLDCISVSELKGLANAILDDLTDLDGIYNALKADEVVGSYEITYAPWAVEVEYIADGNYIDFSIGATDNKDLMETYNIGLKVIGTNKDKLLELICELRDITSIDVEVDIKKPSYDSNSNTLYLAGNAAVAAEINLFNSCTYLNTDYITIFTVLFANAGAENADAMVAALNNKDYDAVKAAFDEMTVADVFEAMKALDRGDDFAELASSVGVTVDTADADRLESLYHLFIVGVGKALEVAENGTVNNAVAGAIDKIDSDTLDNVSNKVTNRIDAFLKNYAVAGLEKKLGALDQDNDGTYELALTATRNPDVTVRGYTADVNIEKITLSLKVVIFEPVNCLWGDADHLDGVDIKDPTLILQYIIGLEPDPFCTVRTDVDQLDGIDIKDATYVLQYIVGLVPELPVETE